MDVLLLYLIWNYFNNINITYWIILNTDKGKAKQMTCFCSDLEPISLLGQHSLS